VSHDLQFFNQSNNFRPLKTIRISKVKVKAITVYDGGDGGWSVGERMRDSSVIQRHVKTEVALVYAILVIVKWG